MKLNDLKVPENCGYFAFKYPFDNKKGYMCFEVEPGEWCPLGHLEGHEFVYCCAVAAMFWRQAENELRLKQDVEGFDENRNTAFLVAHAQGGLWQRAAFEEVDDGEA